MMVEKKIATELPKIIHPNQLCESCLVFQQQDCRSQLKPVSILSDHCNWFMQICVARSAYHRLLVISSFSYLLTIIFVDVGVHAQRKKERHYLRSRSSKDSLKTGMITSCKPYAPTEVTSFYLRTSQSSANRKVSSINSPDRTLHNKTVWLNEKNAP